MRGRGGRVGGGGGGRRAESDRETEIVCKEERVYGRGGGCRETRETREGWEISKTPSTAQSLYTIFKTFPENQRVSKKTVKSVNLKTQLLSVDGFYQWR